MKILESVMFGESTISSYRNWLKSFENVFNTGRVRTNVNKINNVNFFINIKKGSKRIL